MPLPDHPFAEIAVRLGQALRRVVDPRPRSSVHGGCINDSYRWESRSGPLFVKVAGADRLSMFEAEAEGLRELADAGAVRVPRVLAVGCEADRAFLALEWIDLGASSSRTAARLGEQLAQLHRKTAAQFGWRRDNTIGSTPQINTPASDWPTFLRDQRLRYQLDLARRSGAPARLLERGARLLERIGDFFADHRPEPSLLHGDLWGGNFAADASGVPVLFDPAVYYGDREADIAMTRLFGGFPASFYAAYESVWPLSSSARERTDLYNLYHVLNHFNLFGGGYRAQAEALIDRLLARVGQ
ncbi:MAG: fructosamine kinase family protein [Steroidobacteraceae bacterium]|nr:fructosamine kinase family protein [Steroidobacteraceae bacterium]